MQTTKIWRKGFCFIIRQLILAIIIDMFGYGSPFYVFYSLWYTVLLVYIFFLWIYIFEYVHFYNSILFPVCLFVCVCVCVVVVLIFFSFHGLNSANNATVSHNRRKFLSVPVVFPLPHFTLSCMLSPTGQHCFSFKEA